MFDSQSGSHDVTVWEEIMAIHEVCVDYNKDMPGGSRQVGQY